MKKAQRTPQPLRPALLVIGAAFACATLNAAPPADEGKARVSACPNVHGGGMSFGASAEAAAQVTAAVREVVKESALFIKLSPNVTNIVAIAGACADEGADGLTLINTLQGMRIDVTTRRPVIAERMGGLSGLG